AATPSTVGVLLSSTPPPPLTWASRKPGSSQPPSRSTRSASRSRASPSSTTAAIPPPSSSTALPSRKPASPRTRPLTSAVVISRTSDGLGDLVQVRRLVRVVATGQRQRVHHPVERLHQQQRRAGRMRCVRHRQVAAGPVERQPHRCAAAAELVGQRLGAGLGGVGLGQ